MVVYSSVSVGACRRRPRSAPRADTGCPAPWLGDLSCFVTGRLLSSRDVFTSGTPVKRNGVVADPLVSNLTTGVIGAPLDLSTTPAKCLTATGRAVLGVQPSRLRERWEPGASGLRGSPQE